VPVKTAGAFACEDCQAPRTGKDQRNQGSGVEIATSDIGTNFSGIKVGEYGKAKGKRLRLKELRRGRRALSSGIAVGTGEGGRWVNVEDQGGGVRMRCLQRGIKSKSRESRVIIKVSRG
jgi:hypothetical protein